MLRELQSRIHSNTSLNVDKHKSLRLDIYTEYDTWTDKVLHQDVNPHLLREFNRKVSLANAESLAFSPFDGGYRYIGPDLQGKFGVHQSYPRSSATFSGVVS